MIRRFFSYYKPHRRLFIIDFTSAIIVAILELAFPVAVQWFVDDLLPGENWNLIIQVGIGLFLIYLLSTFLQYVVTYWGHKLGLNIETDMREDLFQHVQKQSYRFFDNTMSGGRPHWSPRGPRQRVSRQAPMVGAGPTLFASPVRGGFMGAHRAHTRLENVACR